MSTVVSQACKGYVKDAGQLKIASWILLNDKMCVLLIHQRYR